MARKRLEFLVVSSHLGDHDVRAAYPSAQAVGSWESALEALAGTTGARPTRVALYCCAPLLVPVA